MTSFAVSPAPRESFGAGVVVSTALHAALLAALLFGGMLFQTQRLGSPTGVGDIINVSLGGGEGLPLPWRPVVKSNAPPSSNPGDRVKKTAPEPAAVPAAPKAPKEPKPASRKTTAAPPTPKPATNPKAIPLAGAKTKAVEPKPAAPPTQPTAAASAKLSQPSGNPLPPQPAETSAAPADGANGNPGGTGGILGNGSSPDIPRGGGGGISNGNGSTDVMFGEARFDYPDYARRLKQAVSPYFEPPAATRGRTVAIRMTIAKDGTASDVEIERKSRNDALDASARKAVTRAIQDRRIPPLPGDYRGSSIHVTMLFESER